MPKPILAQNTALVVSANLDLPPGTYSARPDLHPVWLMLQRAPIDYVSDPATADADIIREIKISMGMCRTFFVFIMVSCMDVYFFGPDAKTQLGRLTIGHHPYAMGAIVPDWYDWFSKMAGRYL